jgi:uncharacterized protein (TIGR03067 family)
LFVGLLLPAIATMVSAEDAQDQAIKEERQRIAGTWRIVALVVNGAAAKEEDAKKLTVVNGSDGTWSLRSEDQELSKGTSTLDPTQKPKTIDFTPTVGETNGKQFLGIYEIGAETRKLCFAPPGKERPSQFSSAAGSEQILVVFERVKIATPMEVNQNLPYVESQNDRQTLDIYAPIKGDGHPVVLWIHGGGWRRGDKANVQQKPQAFVDRGFVFVSANYRFVPDVTVAEQAGDIAKAIRWIHDHAQDYGGSPDSIFIAGHSAGAHLAALVCTDERYLKAERLSLANIAGCIPVDSAAYDVPRRITLSVLRGKRFYTNVFTEDEDKQKAVSPLAHVSEDKRIPPFLILHVADRPAAKMQSEAFARALRASGVAATVFAAEDKTHMTINSELGQPDDPPTKALFGFLDQVLSARQP